MLATTWLGKPHLEQGYIGAVKPVLGDARVARKRHAVTYVLDK